MAFLKSSSLCAGLPDSCLSQLISAARLVELSPGEVVVAEGGVDQALYIVIDGQLAMRKGSEGNVVELAKLARSSVFGESAALTQQPRIATVITEVDARLIRIPGETVRAVADVAPKLGRRLAALMAGRSKDTEVKLTGL